MAGGLAYLHSEAKASHPWNSKT